MNKPDFITAEMASHRNELLELNLEYVSWVVAQFELAFGVNVEEVVGMSTCEYVHSVIDKVCGDPPPKGVFYLVKVENQLAGMGGLRRIRGDLVEIKRIYVRPTFRGMKLGEQILDRLLEDAKQFGYESACLESGPFMKIAQRLYERKGFKDCAVYEKVEVPEPFHHQWRFMERQL